ncbi:hypothetical protein L1887_07497 [Cichorium endivia]|nr:hypothetical protein L1887_07497 [Cichorium endivia]
MDGQILMGRQLTVVFAEESRKKPTDMRQRERRRTGQRSLAVTATSLLAPTATTVLPLSSSVLRSIAVPQPPVRDMRGPPKKPSQSPAARGYSRGEADADVSPSP